MLRICTKQRKPMSKKEEKEAKNKTVLLANAISMLLEGHERYIRVAALSSALIGIMPHVFKDDDPVEEFLQDLMSEISIGVKRGLKKKKADEMD